MEKIGWPKLEIESSKFPDEPRKKQTDVWSILLAIIASLIIGAILYSGTLHHNETPKEQPKTFWQKISQEQIDQWQKQAEELGKWPRSSK